MDQSPPPSELRVPNGADGSATEDMASNNSSSETVRLSQALPVRPPFRRSPFEFPQSPLPRR